MPAAVRVEADRLTAQDRFVLTHEVLGITLFSAAGGALRVAEPLVFEFELVGRRR